jgi:hypothetical protein
MRVRNPVVSPAQASKDFTPLPCKLDPIWQAGPCTPPLSIAECRPPRRLVRERQNVVAPEREGFVVDARAAITRRSVS